MQWQESRERQQVKHDERKDSNRQPEQPEQLDEPEIDKFLDGD